MATYICPNRGGSHVLVRENQIRFYDLVDLQKEEGYYETGKEWTGEFSVTDRDFVCHDCYFVMSDIDVIISEGTEQPNLSCRPKTVHVLREGPSPLDRTEDDNPEDTLDDEGRTPRVFSSVEVATAFCEGVDFVNDSALTYEGPIENEDGTWTVYLIDLF